MRLIKIMTPAMILLFMACEVAQLVYDNPLDKDDGEVPALVFSPSTIETSVGGSAVFEIFATTDLPLFPENC